ncbi:HCP-like protein [Violaceomyces palustris]|uniref:HCP-like protein n=1 Tax=Violaceomyces palustris TaxID=1673888 RepID=A0ACD0P7V9_9BASI|nr:HCP-like protein [Violaceomyces palustris]
MYLPSTPRVNDLATIKAGEAEPSDPTGSSIPSNPANVERGLPRTSITTSPTVRHEPRSSASIYSADNHRESGGNNEHQPVDRSIPVDFDSLNLGDSSTQTGDRSQADDGYQAAGAVGQRTRPSSFFGMERPLAAVKASGQHVPIPHGVISDDNPAVPTYRGEYLEQTEQIQAHLPHTQTRPDGLNGAASGARPSSFFGMDSGAPAIGETASNPAEHQNEDQRAQRFSAHQRSDSERRGVSTAAGGTGNAPIPVMSSGGSTYGGLGPSVRPASMAPSASAGPLLDHSHLKPGEQAALLSHGKTLELYRQNAKKTNDPNLIYELAVFMIDASKTMGSDTASGGSGPSGKEDRAKEELIKEATGLLKKIADRGHPDAQYFLADCYANGIGTQKGKQDFGSAYTYFVLAAKHGHPDAAYRAGTCYEKGWGCRRDVNKALQFYRKAASQNHPGAMYRLATAELNGELGLKKSAKEGVKWLKRSAEAATPEFPHALHELALLHERGIDNVLFVDPEYSCELLAQAGEMGYAPSAYKLGVNYEYGRMGCPQDGGLSIHMYNIAAQQNHKEACFALTAWYLVGAPGILPQSDTEAYLWAKKAAEQGLAKAEYAVGYFTEMGIGTVKDLAEAKAWYRSAAEHGDKRANQRLAGLGGKPEKTLAGVGAGAIVGHNLTDYGKRGLPANAPFPGSVGNSGVVQNAQPSYPAPMAMREAQSAQREQQYLANVAATERAQTKAGPRPQLDGVNDGRMPRPPFNERPSPSQQYSGGRLDSPPRQAYPSYPASAGASAMTGPGQAPFNPAQLNSGKGSGPMQISVDESGRLTQTVQGATLDDSSKKGKKKSWFGRA